MKLLAVIALSTTMLFVSAPTAVQAAVEPGVDALFVDETPGTVNWPDTNPVEVGVRFVTSEDISVMGVRFYKGDLNTGIHLGSLWDAGTGERLAQSQFTNETTSGWQDVLFDEPVAMSPGDVYIASYYVPVGYYSADNDYFFDNPVTVGPVTALSSTNGVYTYGPSSAFPEFTYRSSNYWVTPLWTTNAPPIVDAGPDTSGTEGSGIALTGGVSDPDGDEVTSQWSISSGPDDGGTCTFANPAAPTTTVTCTDDGTVVATLTATDGFTSASDSVTITVGNAAPTVIPAYGEGAPVAVGHVLDVSGTVSDPGSNDVQTCTIAWGDGTTSGPSATCNFSHAYPTSDVYTATMTVTDDDSGSSTASFTVVVYDPSAGFVTGGGWFDSPIGSYLADPGLTGKATFGFTSQYKKGATVPTGNTQFQFSAGGLTFHSSSYDWLVVAGARSANFKGTGSLDGVSGYKFMVWAGDGTPDSFRIRIWSNPDGTGVVYDNNANTALGGGQVVIHTKK